MENMVKVCSRLLFLSAICLFIAQPNFENNFVCSDKGNYTSNSTYKANLNHLLSTLTSNTQIDYGFYNSSYGQDPDKVYAIGLCRGDVNSDECRSCLNKRYKSSHTALSQSEGTRKQWNQMSIAYYGTRSAT